MPASATRSACPRACRPSSARASTARLAAGRRARRSRGLEGAPLRRARLYRSRRLARLGRLPGAHRAGPGRLARVARVRSGRGAAGDRRSGALGRIGALRRRPCAAAARFAARPSAGRGAQRPLPGRGARPRHRRRGRHGGGAQRLRCHVDHGERRRRHALRSGDRARAPGAPRRLAAAAGQGAQAPRRGQAARTAGRRARGVARRAAGARGLRGAREVHRPRRRAGRRAAGVRRHHGEHRRHGIECADGPRHEERRAQPAARVSPAAHRARFPERPGGVGAPGRRRRRAAHSVAHVFQRAPERQRAWHVRGRGRRAGDRRPFGAVQPRRRDPVRALSPQRASWAARRRASGL